jgi:hypothetical protein
VTQPRRVAARHLHVPVLVLTLALLGACTSSTATRAPSIVPASRAPSSGRPSLTPVPGGASTPVISPTVASPGTTEVMGFGRILDALPPSFPRLPGQEPADTGAGATSGSFAANLEAGAAGAMIEAALKATGWAVDAGSPLEDGSVVLEASRPNACKAEIRFTPQTGSVIMSVLYGATCPYP